MSSRRFEEIRLAFGALVDRPLSERPAILEQLGADDPELRDELQKLLAAHGREHAVLDAEGAACLLGLAAERKSPDVHQVGAYRIVRMIAEGGMGIVFEAHRCDDVFTKRVAVKVCKATLIGEAIRDRFRRERQILARLEHPNIARILDGGTTEDGAPYFVMEYVDGLPLNRFVERRPLGLEQRLRLFCDVCGAVAYAHRNLVVHRDLKPSNILVDAGGSVKLLDFGIAKLLAEGTEGSPEGTRTLLRVMTPEYAAPEQVRGDPVTTATDVYTLGVLLYELLTGQRPYRVTRSVASEWQQAILEQEPLRPSARVAGGPKTGTPEALQDSALPGLDRRELKRRLRGDLDWIVLKALQKEPERRYASAEALSAEIERHLRGLPVSARGDALSYRGSKFLRRHRVGAAAAALVFLSLIGGLVGSTWQARRAAREARKAEAVKNFLKSLFSASDPAQAQGKERSARQLLEDGARRIETEMKDQPEVQSEVARLIAGVYEQLGEYEQAGPLLQADLERHRRLDGPRSVAVAESQTQLGDVLYDQGRIDEAGALYQEALAIRRQRGGGRTPEVAELLWDLGGVRRNRDDLAGAEALDREALALFVATKGEDSREAVNVRESLAILYAQDGRLTRALSMAEAVAAWREKHFGPDHPESLNARYNLSTYLLRLGRVGDALRVGEEVVERQRRVLGQRNDRLATALRVLARALDGSGRSEEALLRIAEALSIHRERFGPNHLQVAMDLAWQGMIASHTGRLVEAERDCRQALDVLTAMAAFAPTDLATIRMYAGIVLTEARRLGEADKQLTEALVAFRTRLPQAILLGCTLDALGDVARQRGENVRATELGREALSIAERSAGADPRATTLARVHYGRALWDVGRVREGEQLLRAGLGELQREFPTGHFDLASARFLFGEALAKSGRDAEARPLLQDALEWRQAHLGSADPRTAAVRRVLESLS